MTSAHVIDGKALADSIIRNLYRQIDDRRKGAPGLATVLVGENPASKVYVANKIKAAERAGIKSFDFKLDTATTQSQLIELIDKLNNDNIIDAILVQLPLPKQISEQAIIERINPDKDVDGFHPLNLGRLLSGIKSTVACTPLGVMHMIESVNYPISGKHAVVVGRSTIVGKPMAQLLLQKDATVTMCHSKTRNLAEITKQADIVIAAIGQPKFINDSHIKKGALVIDVGMNRDASGKLCGDVDFDRVKPIASYLSPVPGGVGPLTIAMLLKNSFDNFVRRSS